MAQVPLAKDDDMVRHSCRIEPINRSVSPFCHGVVRLAGHDNGVLPNAETCR